jgi:DHA2 family methylenomycin A resistance protein-like MFS transporter
VLAVLATARFIDTLDVTIVNVALPHIGRDLHFGTASIQWVISAYTLTYIAAALAVLTALLVFLAPRLRPTTEQVAAATA